MSDAEHLIENVIHAMYENRVDEEFNAWYNQEMMKNTGIKREDLYSMAQHIVYSLYEGLNPFSKYFDEVMDYCHYLKGLGLDLDLKENNNTKKNQFKGVMCFPTPEERLEYFNKNIKYMTELYSFEDNETYDIYLYEFEEKENDYGADN